MKDPIAAEQQAWNDYNELSLLIKNDIHSILRKGELLKTLRDTENYKKLGDGGYDTWESFIADPQLKMSRGYVYQHIQMFDFYILELQMPADEVAKISSIKLLGDCMRYITRNNLNREEAMEVIAEAQSLSLSDFITRIKERDPQALIDNPDDQQHQQPQQPLLPTREQVDEAGEFHKPHVSRCDMCSKSRVEYFEDQICQCTGVFQLINKSQEEDYQHDHSSEGVADPVAEEGGEN